MNTEPVELVPFEPEPLFTRYSPRHEFPISLVASALLLLLIVGAMYLAFYAINHSVADTKPVPIQMVQGGEDEAGDGKTGGEGVPEPGTISLQPPTQEDFAQLPEKTALPDVAAEIQKAIQINDPNGSVEISEEKKRALASLSKTLRDKLLNANGSGATGPKGNDGDQPGDGNGGKGANSSKERSLRWVLRFKTDTGRDYLNQLSAMGALVFVPIPPDNNRGYLFRDLKNPGAGELIDEVGLAKIAGLIRFCDFKRQSVREVSGALNIAQMPDSFWAFFPRSLETDLARKEEAYLGRRAEEIGETVFQVVVREGRAEVIVVGQKAKK